jgi:hypothetical protein
MCVSVPTQAEPHSRSWKASPGQFVPPWSGAGLVHVRVLFSRPCRHVCVSHLLQSDHWLHEPFTGTVNKVLNNAQHSSNHHHFYPARCWSIFIGGGRAKVRYQQPANILHWNLKMYNVQGLTADSWKCIVLFKTHLMPPCDMYRFCILFYRGFLGHKYCILNVCVLQH